MTNISDTATPISKFDQVDSRGRGMAQMAAWEKLHPLIRAATQDCESAAAAPPTRMLTRAKSIDALAYPLAALCEDRTWGDDARAYNNELAKMRSAGEQPASEAANVGTQRSLDI